MSEAEPDETKRRDTCKGKEEEIEVMEDSQKHTLHGAGGLRVCC
jgi:hypothetical protein